MGGMTVKRAAFVLALTLTACGGGNSTQTVTGTITVVGDNTSFVIDSCTTTGGYRDVSEGANVNVTDESGTLVATAPLSAGTRNEVRGCDFHFTVSVPTGKKFYRFEVSHRGQVSFSGDDLKAKGTVALTLGG